MKTVVLAAMTVFLAGTVSAQSTEELTPGDQGKSELLFSINGLNLAGFNGGTGVKNWRSDRFAIVSSVDFSWRTFDRTEGTSTVDGKRVSAAWFIGIERLLGSPGRMMPYLALHPGIRFSHDRTEQAGPSEPDRATTRRSTTVHVRPAFGLLYQWTEEFSLAAEYYLDGRWTRSSRTDSVEGEQDMAEIEDTELSIATGFVRLTLAIRL